MGYITRQVVPRAMEKNKVQESHRAGWVALAVGSEKSGDPREVTLQHRCEGGEGGRGSRQRDQMCKGPEWGAGLPWT